MELVTDDVKSVQEDVVASVLVVGHGEIKPDGKNAMDEASVFVLGHTRIEPDGENGVELVAGDVKPAREDADASVEPAGGGEG